MAIKKRTISAVNARVTSNDDHRSLQIRRTPHCANSYFRRIDFTTKTSTYICENLIIMKRFSVPACIKCLLLTISTLISTDADTLNKTQPDIFFRPALSASVRNPVRQSAHHWKSYSSAGLKFEFPSKMNNLHCEAAFETGHVLNKLNNSSAYLLHIHFGVLYNANTPLKWLKIVPQISITNTMMSEFNVFDALFKTDRISFADVENEYGLRAGIEPRLVLGNFFFGIPIIIERTFSDPDPFDLFLITINTGYTFYL